MELLSIDALVGVAVDRLLNFGAFVDTIVGDGQYLRQRCGCTLTPQSPVIMAMRIYAMYLGSRIVLGILVAIILTRVILGLVIAIVIFGPRSGIAGTFLLFMFSPTVGLTSIDARKKKKKRPNGSFLGFMSAVRASTRPARFRSHGTSSPSSSARSYFCSPWDASLRMPSICDGCSTSARSMT